WKAHKKLLVSHIAEHVNKDQTWTPCGGEGYGAMAFLNAAKAWTHAEVNFDRRTGLIQSIKNNVDDAQASDPDRQSYSFDTIANHRYNSNGEYVSTTYSEQPTRSSWDKWYGSTDKSAYLWQLIIQEIDELFAIEELGSKYYVKPISHMDELRNVRSLGEREIQRLLKNRGRGPQG
ncbi:MAG: hypothetical protein VX908_06945, partial [Planctomycetota bacterium]|nr:hypothetical protein [Planctomycetota bacterium]